MVETPRRAWTWQRFPGLFMSSKYCILFHLYNRNEISAVFSKIEVLPHLVLRYSLTMARWFPSWLGSQEIYLSKLQNQEELVTIKKLGNAISRVSVPLLPPVQLSFGTVSHVWSHPCEDASVQHGAKYSRQHQCDVAGSLFHIHPWMGGVSALNSCQCSLFLTSSVVFSLQFVWLVFS